MSVNPHSDQASHAATRALILPSPRSCSLAPSVTTSLYRITVSQPLRRNALRGSLYEARSERTSENSVLAKFAFWDFSEVRIQRILRSSLRTFQKSSRVTLFVTFGRRSPARVGLQSECGREVAIPPLGS